MKAEERHELKENSLQSWLQYGLPVWLKQNGSYLLLAVALVILGFELWSMYQRKQEAKVQTAVRELLAAERPDAENPATKLQAIIDQYDIKTIRALAYRDLGNAYLDSVATGVGDGGKPVDKSDALNRAQGAYEEVIKNYPDQMLALGGAKLGLGAVAEDRGDWDAARKAYQELSAKEGPFAGTAVTMVAAAKLAAIPKAMSAPPLASLAPAPSTLPGMRPSHSSGAGAVAPPGTGPLGPELPPTTAPVAPRVTVPFSTIPPATQPK